MNIKLRNIHIALNVLDGITLQDAGSEYGLSGVMARQITVDLCREAYPRLFYQTNQTVHNLRRYRNRFSEKIRVLI